MITNKPLHEITGAICNRQGALQAVITGGICNQALQEDAVITCNRGSVIGPLDMTTSADATPAGVVSERIKGDYVSYVFNPAAAIDDEQRSVSPAFLSTPAYYRSLTVGDIPDRCPSCGSREIAPMFWPDTSLDVWDCANPACHAIFCVRD